MPRVRVLVTLTSEAVVDVSDDEDNVDGFLREQVSLAWGDAVVERIVAEDVSVAFYAVEEPVVEPGSPAVEEVAEPATQSYEDEAPPTFVAAASTRVEEVPSLESASAESVFEVEAPPVEGDERVAVEYEPELLEAEPAASAHVDEVEAPGPRVLTSHEMISLFTDPIYAEMIRAAVRDRAVRMLEPVVAEVIDELEPLLRRQAERRRSTGA
jgi:hypothetical protein